MKRRVCIYLSNMPSTWYTDSQLNKASISQLETTCENPVTALDMGYLLVSGTAKIRSFVGRYSSMHYKLRGYKLTAH